MDGWHISRSIQLSLLFLTNTSTWLKVIYSDWPSSLRSCYFTSEVMTDFGNAGCLVLTQDKQPLLNFHDKLLGVSRWRPPETRMTQPYPQLWHLFPVVRWAGGCLWKSTYISALLSMFCCSCCIHTLTTDEPILSCRYIFSLLDVTYLMPGLSGKLNHMSNQFPGTAVITVVCVYRQTFNRMRTTWESWHTINNRWIDSFVLLCPGQGHSGCGISPSTGIERNTHEDPIWGLTCGPRIKLRMLPAVPPSPIISWGQREIPQSSLFSWFNLRIQHSTLQALFYWLIILPFFFYLHHFP